MKSCFALSCLLLVTACASTTDIKVEVPANARADSATPINIVAKLTFRGINIADNTEVRFKASAGSFALGKDMPEGTARSSGGEARIDFYPPNTPGDVTITVSFTNANRETISHDQVIALTRLPPADADQISLGCEAYNVGALGSGLPKIEITCTAQAKDKLGNPVPGAEMAFAAEAGHLVDAGPQANGTRKVTYVIEAGSAPPADVPAHELELEANGNLADHLVTYENGNDRNPRDGLATLVVAVRGAEAFQDQNGNGVYDDGEFWDDEDEPFVDVDDDGFYDSTRGDKFFAAFDGNGNGQWDPANGKHDSDTMIGRSAHVLWTGAPEIFIEGSASFPPQQARNYSVFMRDQNGNPPAGFDMSSDRVDLTVSNKPSKLSINGLVQQPLSTENGMQFGRGRLHSTFQGFVRETSTQYPVLRRFDISVTDARTTDEVNASGTLSFTFSGSVRYTPGPRAQNVQQRSVQLPALQVQIIKP